MVDLKQVDTRIAEVRACEGLLGIVSRMRSNEGLINTQTMATIMSMTR